MELLLRVEKNDPFTAAKIGLTQFCFF
jgi:hypothetical protein